MGRTTPFQPKHALEFGLELMSADDDGEQTARCLFCVYEGRQKVEVGATTGRKRKERSSVHVFTKPFKPAQYRSHLKQHAASWETYQALSEREKAAYFLDRANQMESRRGDQAGRTHATRKSSPKREDTATDDSAATHEPPTQHHPLPIAHRLDSMRGRGNMRDDRQVPPTFELLDDKCTGLLVMDVQYYCAKPNFGKHHAATSNAYYFDRIQTIVVPHIQALLAAWRARMMEVIFGTIECATKDGRDRSHAYKMAGIHVPKDNVDARVLEEMAADAAIVIPRTAQSFFGTTNVDYVCRNLGLKALVVVGVSTLGSLETTVRDALDHGYATHLVEDAIALASPAEHDAFVAHVSKMGATVVQTQNILGLQPVESGASSPRKHGHGKQDAPQEEGR
ncbi:Aste57867_10191 [Aphanomyces stellatus]|uniref:Aste57867_10191 protein n=1 Tax=Aphanomyces stellatus TaxID=120398 RepID=A0A485KQ83_9STRA|nr:hypothetical protein As57867_010152 [Aphanomyces stellatus]VFT87067.1 Aste57867_10191 [Aphanomyces stellatus]